MRTQYHHIVVFSIFIMLMTILPCSAATYKYPKANIQFELADNWRVSSREPLMLVAPAGDTVLVCEVTRASCIEDAITGAETFLAINLADISIGVPEYMKINGIPAAAVEGTGTIRKMPADYRLLVLEGKKGTYALLYYFGEKGHQRSNSDALKRFATSIRKLR